MANQKVNQEQEVNAHEETSSVGTYLGVGLVGVVILISYITLYGLYMARV